MSTGSCSHHKIEHLAFLLGLLMLAIISTTAGAPVGEQLTLQHAALIIVDVQKCFMHPDGELPVPDGRTILPIINQLRTAFNHTIVTQDWHPRDHISFYTVHEDGRPMQHRRLLYTPDGRLLAPSRQHSSNSSAPASSSNASADAAAHDGTCQMSNELVSEEPVEVDQVLWPPHCIMGTPSAALLEDLRTSPRDTYVRKGSNPDVDAYSAFWDAGHFHTTCVVNPECKRTRRQDNNSTDCTSLHEELQCRGVTDVFVTGVAADYCVKFTAIDAADLGYRTWLVQDATRPTQKDALPEALRELEAHGVHTVDSSEVLKTARHQLVTGHKKRSAGAWQQAKETCALQQDPD